MTKANLTNGQTVAELYDFARGREWVGPTERDRLQFFALCRYVAHRGEDPGRYLTYCLREKLWGNIRQEDEEAARVYLAARHQPTAAPAPVALLAATFAAPTEDDQARRDATRMEIERRIAGRSESFKSRARGE